MKLFSLFKKNKSQDKSGINIKPDSIQMFHHTVRDGDGVCSETSIPRGTGYLYIDPIAVAFRKTYPING